MIEKQSLNIPARFYSRLWLLQEYVYLTLEKILVTESGARRSYNWADFLKFIFFNWGGDKLISEYFDSKF